MSSSPPNGKIENNKNTPPPKTSTTSSSEGWKKRIYIPTVLAGVIGGGAGLLSKHSKAHGVAHVSTTYATNLAIITGCYCGTRELVREVRASEPGDLINSVVGGIVSGALLGRLQGHTLLLSLVVIFLFSDIRAGFWLFWVVISVGNFISAGHVGAVRYSIIFTCAGTAVDFAAPRLQSLLTSSGEPASTNDSQEKSKKSGWSWPDWAPIQVYDEEAAAAKRDREQQLSARQRIINNKLNKEGSIES